jgi:hypothetical protein
MDWKQKIPGCFGLVDGEFAVHPADRGRAEAAIKAAQACGANFDELEKEIVWHCYKHLGGADAHTDYTIKQVSIARQLWGETLRATMRSRKLELLAPPGL